MLSSGAGYHNTSVEPQTPQLEVMLHRQSTWAAPTVTFGDAAPSCRLSRVSCRPSCCSCLPASSPSGPAAIIPHAYVLRAQLSAHDTIHDQQSSKCSEYYCPRASFDLVAAPYYPMKLVAVFLT